MAMYSPAEIEYMNQAMPKCINHWRELPKDKTDYTKLLKELEQSRNRQPESASDVEEHF